MPVQSNTDYIKCSLHKMFIANACLVGGMKAEYPEVTHADTWSSVTRRAGLTGTVPILSCVCQHTNSAQKDPGLEFNSRPSGCEAP